MGMSDQMYKYEIDNPDLETECLNCGCPLYVGDRAYIVNQDYVVCSKSCKEHYENFLERVENNVRQ